MRIYLIATLVIFKNRKLISLVLDYLVYFYLACNNIDPFLLSNSRYCDSCIFEHNLHQRFLEGMSHYNLLRGNQRHKYKFRLLENIEHNSYKCIGYGNLSPKLSMDKAVNKWLRSSLLYIHRPQSVDDTCNILQ